MTSEAAKGQVAIALRDAPFQHGPWGEPLSVMRPLFLGSTADLPVLPDSSIQAVAGEASVPLDWSLPMGDLAQTYLFTRVRIQFEKTTAIVENAADRKRYRMQEEEILALRNTMCLWSQIRDFCSTRVGKFVELDEALKMGSSRDHELRDIVECRPASFAVSMLPSYQVEAVEHARAQEEGANMEVEAERLKVREARWTFFQAALLRDQQKLRQIQGAPETLAAAKHWKQMAWRLQQAKAGEKAVKAYMDKYCRTHCVKQKEHAQQLINEYRSFVDP